LDFCLGFAFGFTFAVVTGAEVVCTAAVVEVVVVPVEVEVVAPDDEHVPSVSP
jgi:hypothetical protein